MYLRLHRSRVRADVMVVRYLWPTASLPCRCVYLPVRLPFGQQTAYVSDGGVVYHGSNQSGMRRCSRSGCVSVLADRVCLHSTLVRAHEFFDVTCPLKLPDSSKCIF
jgi:hypothetical protein